MTDDLLSKDHRAVGPGTIIGILGGGQLARMLSLAGAPLGLHTHIYDTADYVPALPVSYDMTVAPFEDEAALVAFAAKVDLVTFEFENVPARTAEVLAAHVPVRPGPQALAVAQDRLTEKDFITKQAGAQTAPYMAVDSVDDLVTALDAIGTPAVLKTRRMGYDGKGQVKLTADSNPAEALDQIAHQSAILEGFIPFERELSVVLARSLDGTVRPFDVVENIHRNHILSQTLAPALVDHTIAAEAQAIAARIANALGYVGVLAVEFFLLPASEGQTAAGRLLVNEIAPRVHNSGHWTIEGTYCSQFEQHMRAVAGLPLGDAAMRADAIMDNLVGDEMDQWPALLDDPRAHLHIYGKRETRPGRKMGHVTRLYDLGTRPRPEQSS
ncbi:MAG: 5-(carboxyamino)imidazole ribonucleotide synthase [Alphaproteobacteria bacterium]